LSNYYLISIGSLWYNTTSILGVDFGIVLLYRAAPEGQSSVLGIALIGFFYSSTTLKYMTTTGNRRLKHNMLWVISTMTKDIYL